MKISGDQCTLLVAKDHELHKYFLSMCPTYTFIDRANGKFNGAMDFKKDYAALLSYIWEVDSACDKYLNDPDEDSYNMLQDMGIIISEETDTLKQREEVLALMEKKANKK